MRSPFINAVRDWCDATVGDSSADVSGTTGTYPAFMNVYNTKVVEKDYELKIKSAIAFVEAINPDDYIEADQATVQAYKDKTVAALKAIENDSTHTVLNLFGWNNNGTINTNPASWTNYSAIPEYFYKFVELSFFIKLQC